MDFLEKLQDGRFLVLGRAGMDISPEPAGTSIAEAGQMVADLGGSAANIAVALCRYQLPASLLTVVSQDAVGQFCLAQLKQYGVGTEYVFTVDGEYRTSLAVTESRLLDHQTVIYRNGAADFQLSRAHIDQVDWTSYRGLVLTGTAFSDQEARDHAFYCVDRAKKAGLTIILDIDYRPYSWQGHKEAGEILSSLALLCDVVIGNDEEFAVMSGHQENENSAISLARSLAQDNNKLVIYKRGSQGSITFTQDDTFETGIFMVSALKPTGAGDAFMGGVLSGLQQGLELEEVVKRGSAAAAIVVSSIGCAPAMPTEKQLQDFMQQSQSQL